MRLFVAINLPDAQKQRLAAALAPFTELALPVRWLAADALHITIKFLGNVADEQVAPVRTALRAAAGAAAAFDVAIRGFGAFPSLARPHVFWVGVEPVPALLDLYADVERELMALGFAAESRAFTPHVTVGRPRKGEAVRDHARMDRMAVEFEYNERIRVETVDLMRSQLGSQGARYEVIDRMELQ